MPIPVPKVTTAFRTESPSKKQDTRHSMAEVVMLIVVMGLFYWFILLPKMTELSVQRDRLEQVRIERDSLSENLDKLKALVKDLKSKPDKVKALDEALPLHGKTTDLEMLVEYLAQSSGVTIGDISVSANNNLIAAGNKETLKDPFSVKRNVIKMSASVYVMGTIEQLESFLKKLEKNARTMNVDGLELGAGDEGMVNMKLNIDAFYYE